MELICVRCGNIRYFEVDVEGVIAIEPAEGGIIASDAIIDDWNYSDETIRANALDIVNYAIKEPHQVIQSDLTNSYLRCACCGSGAVTVPGCPWQPPSPAISLYDEITENRHEYLSLRKERHREN